MKEFILYGIGSFYLLWVMYLAVMNLKRARDKGTLTKPIKILAFPLVFVGYIWDVLWNWVFGAALFLEPPQETVFTSHLGEHYNLDTWRGKIATWICDNMLNPFDPDGIHCKEKWKK